MKVKNISSKVICVQAGGPITVLPDQTIEVEDGNRSAALLKDMGLVSVSASKKAGKPAPVKEPEAPVEAEPVIEEEVTEDPAPEQEPGTEAVGKRRKRRNKE